MENNITYNKPVNNPHNLKVGIVAARFNKDIADDLLRKTCDTLKSHKITPVSIIRVPGALEVPIACQKLINKYKPDVVIALGIIIKGKTTHFEHVSTETIHGLAHLSLKSNTPIISGIITALNESQAKQRSSRGQEFALSAIDIADVLQNL